MNFKDIYYFTGKCLALDSNPDFQETIISILSDETFPFEKFVWLCDKHLILPVIYIKFLNFNVLNSIPSELNVFLENIYNLNKKRNLEIIKQVEHINTKLQNENITPVFLKGTGNLIDNIYSDFGERYIGDIDLLVRESDYLKTIDTIISLGYKYEEKELFGNKLPKHFYRLFKNDVPADIEIHRVPVNIPFSKEFNTEMIFANRVLARGKEKIYVPSVDHRIIHNFIHAQLSNKGHWQKNNPLRDLYDLYLLSNYSNLKQVANKVEERNKFISYIFICSRVFNIQQYQSLLKNNKAKLYYLKSNLFLKHSLLHRINLLFYKVLYLLPDRIILASKNKLYRKHILKRIKSDGLIKLFQKQ